MKSKRYFLKIVVCGVTLKKSVTDHLKDDRFFQKKSAKLKSNISKADLFDFFESLLKRADVVENFWSKKKALACLTSYTAH